jgi:hypothetical protein
VAPLFYRQLSSLSEGRGCLAVDYPDAVSTVLADGLAALMDELEIGSTHVLSSVKNCRFVETPGKTQWDELVDSAGTAGMGPNFFAI